MMRPLKRPCAAGVATTARRKRALKLRSNLGAVPAAGAWTSTNSERSSRGTSRSRSSLSLARAPIHPRRSASSSPSPGTAVAPPGDGLGAAAAAAAAAEGATTGRGGEWEEYTTVDRGVQAGSASLRASESGSSLAPVPRLPGLEHLGEQQEGLELALNGLGQLNGDQLVSLVSLELQPGVMAALMDRGIADTFAKKHNRWAHASPFGDACCARPPCTLCLRLPDLPKLAARLGSA
jgi:hypothetical protein